MARARVERAIPTDSFAHQSCIVGLSGCYEVWTIHHRALILLIGLNVCRKYQIIELVQAIHRVWTIQSSPHLSACVLKYAWQMPIVESVPNPQTGSVWTIHHRAFSTDFSA
ncbi:hypothetical protein B0H13DRAFT_1891021 [Mycena leptocephala]|nr:hypothetical protein B0H13DRAFT_1891021 [Mycena leptocephala]